jgi:hypothetical protein
MLFVKEKNYPLIMLQALREAGFHEDKAMKALFVRRFWPWSFSCLAAFMLCFATILIPVLRGEANNVPPIYPLMMFGSFLLTIVLGVLTARQMYGTIPLSPRTGQPMEVFILRDTLTEEHSELVYLCRPSDAYFRLVYKSGGGGGPGERQGSGALTPQHADALATGAVGKGNVRHIVVHDFITPGKEPGNGRQGVRQSRSDFPRVAAWLSAHGTRDRKYPHVASRCLTPPPPSLKQLLLLASRWQPVAMSSGSFIPHQPPPGVPASFCLLPSSCNCLPRKKSKPEPPGSSFDSIPPPVEVTA